MENSKDVTIQKIGDSLGISFTTVCKILNRDPNYRASKETRKLVFKTAKKLGYDIFRLHVSYRRRYKRIKVNIPAEIAIRSAKTNKIYNRGTTIIKDITPCGALITKLRLSKNHIPTYPFICELKILKGRLRGINLKGEPIRFTNKKDIYLGLNFRNVDKKYIENRLNHKTCYK